MPGTVCRAMVPAPALSCARRDVWMRHEPAVRGQTIDDTAIRPGKAPARHAVRIAAASPRPSSPIAISRIRNFWILPVTVIGNSSMTFQ